eukprot:4256775-Prymnesium_polylepis.1
MHMLACCPHARACLTHVLLLRAAASRAGGVCARGDAAGSPLPQPAAVVGRTAGTGRALVRRSPRATRLPDCPIA